MAIVAADAVRIDGLKEFLAKIKAAQGKVPPAIRVGLNGAVALVVADAKGRAPVKTGALRASIKASSTANYARISEGGSRVPYAGFIDYGNKVRAGHGVGRGDSQPRPFIRTGRILYPAFRARRADVVTQLDTSMREALQGIGLDVEA